MKNFGPLLWFYAGWKAATALVIVVGASLPTVVLGWDTMLPSGKIVAVGGLVVSAWKALDMAVRDTVRRILEGKTPVEIPKGVNGGAHDTTFTAKPSEGK